MHPLLSALCGPQRNCIRHGLVLGKEKHADHHGTKGRKEDATKSGCLRSTTSKEHAPILLIFGLIPAVAVPIEMLERNAGNSARSSAMIGNEESSAVGTQKIISTSLLG